MKQGSVCTNATEHATSAHGTATELATSGKNPQLERMFQEACSSSPPKMQSLLQESTSDSREAPVDNDCFGYWTCASRYLGDDGKS